MNLWSYMLGQASSPSYTFRPLSRNRYRCVQTGEIVKKAKLDSYARIRVNEGKRPARHIPAPPPPPRGYSFGSSFSFDRPRGLGSSYWN